MKQQKPQAHSLGAYVGGFLVSSKPCTHTHTGTRAQVLLTCSLDQMKEVIDPDEAAGYHQVDERRNTENHLFTLNQFAAVLQFFFRAEDSAVALHQAVYN